MDIARLEKIVISDHTCRGEASAMASMLLECLRPKARRSDPQTSHAAAQSVATWTDNQLAVLAMFEAHGPMNDAELIERYMRDSTLPPQSTSGLRTRRSELVKLRKLRDSERRTANETGRLTIIWELNQ